MRAIIAALILAITIPVKAAPLDIRIQWRDGYTVDYHNVPEEMSIEQFGARIRQDFPDRSLQDIVVADSKPAKGQAAQPKKDDGEWSPMTKIVVGVLAIAAIAWAWNKFDLGSAAASGACMYTWQTAADGSRCGGRAASVRPGGR